MLGAFCFGRYIFCLSNISKLWNIFAMYVIIVPTKHFQQKIGCNRLHHNHDNQSNQLSQLNRSGV